MSSIAQAVAAIKSDLSDSVPAALVQRLCRQLGHRWRQRDLDPVVTVHLFLQQVLHGNTAITHLRHLSGRDFTPSAYCQARARLPLSLLQCLQRAVADRLQSDSDDADTRWLGHRVFLLDGSSFSMPDTEPLRKYFGQPTGQAEGCGFPVAHLTALFDARRGYLLEATAEPLFTHDLSPAASVHARLRPGDVLVGDRAFGSYAHLALCQQHGIHGLFRAHQKTIIDFRPGRPHNAPGHKPVPGRPQSRWLKQLGEQDQLVEYYKPKECPAWLTEQQYAALPEKLIVRELRYEVKNPGYRTREVTLVTTLLDAEKYPAVELARLYGLRWVAETDLRHLKQTMKMDVLRCETVDGVQKELALFAVIYNLVRRVMEEAGRRQRVEANRISFVDAWRWLQQARRGEALRQLVVNPDRPGRVQPRVRKRRPKNYPLMTRPRAELRKALFMQGHAA
ncbi:MAG TPA: IS4 family transposase [Gemmataceae bacterium]|nr:IS4 family transposase [Gemmataceae bacterium]